jgi:hypothetical protein
LVAVSLSARISGLASARGRWAATRLSHIDAAHAEKACHDYTITFYEAVTVCQTASICESSTDLRRLDLVLLDTEIDAFNNLIVEHCENASGSVSQSCAALGASSQHREYRSTVHNKGFNGDGAVDSYLNDVRQRRDRSTMTPYFVADRAGMICWVTLTLMPLEFIFDCLEKPRP